LWLSNTLSDAAKIARNAQARVPVQLKKEFSIDLNRNSVREVPNEE
jgi:hypothetical protein